MTQRPRPGNAGCRAGISLSAGWRALPLLFLLLLWPSHSVCGQQQPQEQTTGRQVRVTGDRLSGFVLPIEPIEADIHMSALRGWSWTVDDTKRLLLSGDVEIAIGDYRFTSSTATVWMNRIPSEAGLINQIAVYFQQVDNPTQRAGIGVSGTGLLITASARGEVVLSTSQLDPSRQTHRHIVQQGEQRLAHHLRQLLATTPMLEHRPQVSRRDDDRRQEFVPQPGDPIEQPSLPTPEFVELPPLATTGIGELPLFEPQGTIRFSAERIDITPGETENTITCTGGLVVEYLGTDPDIQWSQLTLTAQRAVIFTQPGELRELAQREFDVEQIYGIYLEGRVQVLANRGEYLLRAPRAYYDFRTGQAALVDAVLRTYSRQLDEPVYARAQEMRQIAANQWQAKKVTVSTSEFFTPHVALGARQVTITRRPDEADDDGEIYLESEGNTVELTGVPVFYWPRYAGSPEPGPLRSIEVGTRSNVGFGVQSTWDIYALSGKERPEGVDALAKADVYTNRGAAVGLELIYDVASAQGNVDLYGLFDNGEDRTSSGFDVEQDDEVRGVALLEHQEQLGRYWLMQAQGSYISDPTFITTWRESDFEERREFETSLYFKQQRDNHAFTLLGSYELNDFISNSYLLASRQYQVDKLPEITDRRYGQSLFADWITYSSDTRLSRTRLVFEEHTPRELGVSGGAFGISRDTEVDALLRSSGLSSQWVNRFDSRHELSTPFSLGMFRLVPFVVGRFTAYDNDFEEFSSDADNTRVFGSTGLRLTTRLQRVWNGIESRLLDLHRLRHIMEPSLTLWYGYSDLDQANLPVYDEDVESIADGAAVRLGLKNTWQTKRGGPGRWRSVDVFALNTEAVFNSSEINRESPTSRFYDHRPELSRFGDHFYTSGIWLVSDTFSVAGQMTYDLEDSLINRSSIGGELRHSPVLTTFVEYRFIDVTDSKLLGIGWHYRLTPKYRFSFQPDWDFEEDGFRSVRFQVVRSFPDFDFVVQVRHDDIRDDTSIGASLNVAEF